MRPYNWIAAQSRVRETLPFDGCTHTCNMLSSLKALFQFATPQPSRGRRRAAQRMGPGMSNSLCISTLRTLLSEDQTHVPGIVLAGFCAKARHQVPPGWNSNVCSVASAVEACEH